GTSSCSTIRRGTSKSSVSREPLMESSPRMRPPKPSPWYWTCQAAGWSGFLTYVLIGYFIWGPTRPVVGDIVGIVILSTVVPILMTHGFRYWMYRRGWAQLKEWQRKVRQFSAAPIFAVVCTLAVGVAAGVPEGLWLRTAGAWWTFVAYDFAFG